MDDTGGANLSVEDRRRQLDYIQSVIAQMSSASHTTKGWLLPVIAATYAYGLANANVGVAIVGLMNVAIVALLDANFCGQERAYRLLYEQVDRSENVVGVSVLSVNPAWSQGSGRGRTAGWLPDPSVWSSWVIAPFYGPIVALGLTVLTLSLAS